MSYLYQAVFWIVGVIANFVAKNLPAVIAQHTMLLAYMASIVAIGAGFFAVLELIISGIAYSLPSQYLDVVGVFMPHNLVPCLSLILAARLLRAALQYQKEYQANLRLLARVSRFR